jgi:hypothetical protein
LLFLFQDCDDKPSSLLSKNTIVVVAAALAVSDWWGGVGESGISRSKDIIRLILLLGPLPVNSLSYRTRLTFTCINTQIRMGLGTGTI